MLRGKGVAFEEISLEEHPERRAEMIQRSGRHTVPQIFIGERHIGGSDELTELDADGELDALLAEGRRRINELQLPKGSPTDEH